MFVQISALLLGLTVGPQQIHRVDAAMMDAIQRGHIAGASIAIARNGKILYAHGYGYRDAALKKAADKSTIYEIGSVTKQFTAAAVLMLVRDRKLSLEDPLAKFVPEYRNAADVTVRELLNQTSGIPNYTDDPAFEVWGNKETTPAQLLAHIQAQKLGFLPATQWEYSNTNYFLLGMIIEKVAGMPYATFLQTRVFNPLHLHSTSYTDLQKSGTDDIAAGTAWKNGAFAPSAVGTMTTPFSAGALSSNVEDLTAWDTALFGGQVLPHALSKLMMTPGTLADNTSTDYGMGLGLTRIYGRLFIDHNGGINGFSAYTGTEAESHLQITVLSNTQGVDLGPIVKTLISIVHPPTNTELVASAFHAAKNEDPKITALVKAFFLDAQAGKLDRSLLTPEFSASLKQENVVRTGAALASFGAPTLFEFAGSEKKGDSMLYTYRITLKTRKLMMTLGITAAGKLSAVVFDNAD
ncbi:MAG: serine hydrolase domain-containing protein [Candidatus Baltobacteraceae bacterium]